MKIEEVFARRRFIMLDGAMGTQLQLRGLTTEQKPELAAFIMPDVLTAVHRDYARAGADILLANTFGANPRKLKGTGYTVQQVIEASIACARTAAQETGALVALDIGPIGELLAPAGTLPFEDACAQFAEMVRAGAAAGADLVFLETMTDLYELKAAILAAKENCDLPVFTSMSFEARGRTFTGCTVESYGITAAGLGALRRTQRLALECIAAVLVLGLLALNGCLPTGLILPGAGYVECALAPLLWAVLLVAMAEAARVADGADGTVCGAAFAAMLGLMMLETQLGWFPLAVFPAALAGALMAFLLWDFPPAKLHPGRCGCLYAAGAIGCIPLCIGYAELSIPLALPFWVEGGMVVLQVLFCRWKGRPLFAAAPLHRWLEKRGMSAVNIFYSL